MGGKNRCTAAAAASSRVRVLCLPVKNQKSAVLVNGLDVVPFFHQKIKQNSLSHSPQVACENRIVILRCSVKITQIPVNGITGSRRHAAAHVQGILKSVVDQLSGGKTGNLHAALVREKRFCFPGDFFLGQCARENTGTASGYRPSGRKGALVTVSQRKAEFFFRAGKMAGGGA